MKDRFDALEKLWLQKQRDIAAQRPRGSIEVSIRSEQNHQDDTRGFIVFGCVPTVGVGGRALRYAGAPRAASYTNRWDTANTGAFDPFDELIPLVQEKLGWVHVDGAFGLWLAAVPDLAPRLAGVAMADSWAVDLHKWLNAPYDAGVVVVKDRSSLVSAMSARGAYLPDLTAHWEPPDSTPELSRRARGVPSYAILRHLGREGVREIVRRHCSLAQSIAEAVSAEPGLTVLNEIHSNQVTITCAETCGSAATKAAIRRDC